MDHRTHVDLMAFDTLTGKTVMNPEQVYLFIILLLSDSILVVLYWLTAVGCLIDCSSTSFDSRSIGFKPDSLYEGWL